MIKPSVGRIVLFKSKKEVLPAIVSGVVDDHTVHLHVMTLDTLRPIVLHASVQLLQDKDKPEGAYWAEWMDYQKGQAPASDKVKEEMASIKAGVEAVEGKLKELLAARDVEKTETQGDSKA